MGVRAFREIRPEGTSGTGNNQPRQSGIGIGPCERRNKSGQHTSSPSMPEARKLLFHLMPYKDGVVFCII